MIKSIHSASEVFFAKEFSHKIVGNIDQKDFMDSRNRQRSPEKVFADNLKGKLAEIFIFNHTSKFLTNAKMDFEIYKKGIGDGFDIVSDKVSIDVKASSPKARCLMVELDKARTWKKTGYPSFLCMVAVEEEGGMYYSEYLFGSSFDNFKKNAVLLKRGDYIPRTQMQLKADNYVLINDHCSRNLSDIQVNS